MDEGRIAEVAVNCQEDVGNTYRIWLGQELFCGQVSAKEREASEDILFRRGLIWSEGLHPLGKHCMCGELQALGDPINPRDQERCSKNLSKLGNVSSRISARLTTRLTVRESDVSRT